VVLAGGASRRMGRDKATIELQGETLATRAVRLLGEICGEVVVADAGRRLVEGTASIPDGPGRGPAAGILGAAQVFPGRQLLVLAVDLPRIPVALLAEIAASSADLAIPRWSYGLEPLCALYGPAALAALAERVGKDRFDLHTLPAFPGLTVRYVEEEEIRRFGAPEEIFLNLNRPQDLERL
jgi:molybdopterin-guanine dinucleotide biosynthesis protein A